MADRVLWIGTQLTTEPRSGGAIRSLRLLEALARRADVDLVTTEPSGGDLPVTSHTQLPSPAKAERAVRYALGWPRATARSVSRSAVDAVRGRLPGAAHVVVEWAHLFPLVPEDGPYVLSLHNAESDRSTDRRLVRAERRVTRDARATVVAVSARDAALLGGGTVVPNGTDVPGSVTEVPADGELVFVGAMDYAPNRDAVEWWSSSVWRPGLPALTVAGRAAEALPTLEGVRNAGEVDSVAPMLERAALVVVPLRQGGGTRLKVLEAFAAGRPVLSTTKGVEGLDYEGACAVADDAAAFRDAVGELLGDVARRRALAAAGRHVAERHAWGPIGERFADVVLASPRRRP